MNPLIFFEDKGKYNTFEANKVKKDLIYCLRFQNINYVSSLYDEIYDIIHFVRIGDIAHYSQEIKPSAKIVLSILSCEEDFHGRVLQIEKNKEQIDYQEVYLSKNDINLINKAHLVLVPSLKAKEFLEEEGIKTKIEVFNMPLRHSNFDLKHNVLQSAIYRYLSLSPDMEIAFTTIYSEDYDAFERIVDLATSFPKIKFIAISHLDPKKTLWLKLRKLLKNAPSNLILTSSLEEDIYYSLLYNAKYYFNLSSSFGNDLELFEAMASKTQIFSLEKSQWSDIAINKETCYIFNDFDELKIVFRQYLEGLLESTVENAYTYSKEFTLSSQSLKLINYYKDLLEE